MSDPNANLFIEVQNNTGDEHPEPRDWYPSSQAQELVRKFHEAFDEPIGHTPQNIGPIRGFLHSDLIRNALEDYEKAVNDDDLVDQYSALIEILLQTYSTLVEMGADAGPGKREVMLSRMTMLNEVFEKPDLFKILTQQGWKPDYVDYLKYQDLKDPQEVLQEISSTSEVIQEVVKFVPDENPETDTIVSVKRGFNYNGVNYFDDEPHPYTKRETVNFCVCGKIKVDIVHYQKPEEPGIDWDIDNNVPRVAE